MPKSVMNMQLTPTQGRYTFDQVKKTLIWEVGRIDSSKVPNIKGNVSFSFLIILLSSHGRLNLQEQLNFFAIFGFNSFSILKKKISLQSGAQIPESNPPIHVSVYLFFRQQKRFNKILIKS